LLTTTGTCLQTFQIKFVEINAIYLLYH